ncbi:MAG: membrane protein insertion efficiency factor YidD [Candidatus Delongbacteria bacterium]|nr:membrane protein insertion efficiency factor YidD [Candidatus Delongbacteria bacterium]
MIFWRLSGVKNLLISLIRVYQKAISPFKTSKCPFSPSCSEYSALSIDQYGVFKGFVLGSWRILRCNPLNKGYFDPPKHWAQKLHFEKENNSK